MISDEIPETVEGLKQYYRLALKQIKESQSLIKKLENRVSAIEKKAESLNIKLN